MKISCFRTDLANAVSNVSRAVSSKASIPALEGVLIKAYGDKLNISGYNLEIGITLSRMKAKLLSAQDFFLILYADFPRRSL